MPHARFYKTLFLPPLEGQYLLWKNDFAKLASKVDEIVQLGNLVGCFPAAKDSPTRGPNLSVLNYILLWRSTFPNWTQILGPNEIMALNFPEEWTNAESSRILRRRWLLEDSLEAGGFQVAAVNKERLVSHGGLTYGEWVSLGRPSSAAEAATALNEKYRRRLHMGPSFKTHGRPSYAANPVFADPLLETYGSWITAPEDPPFGQVHAANGFNSPAGRGSLTEDLSPLRYITHVKFTTFGSIALLGEKPFYAVTPEIPRDHIAKHLKDPWQPYIEKIPVVDMRDEIFAEEGD